MENKDAKTLSNRPVGYVIAVLGGGIFGGPIGLFLSPLVLVLLNLFIEDNAERKYNRLLIWALIGIAGAPLSLYPVFWMPDTNRSSKVEKKQEQTQSSRETPEPIRRDPVKTEKGISNPVKITKEEVRKDSDTSYQDEANASLMIIAACTWSQMGRISRGQIMSFAQQQYAQKHGNPDNVDWSRAITIAEQLDKREKLGCLN
jgi:hypothetical protein